MLISVNCENFKKNIKICILSGSVFLIIYHELYRSCLIFFKRIKFIR